MQAVKIWGLRILMAAGLVLLCALADSPVPAWGFCVAWGPNGVFLYAFERGLLRLPRFLEPVNPVEPMLYRWAGVGLVKRIVETPTWPMMIGFPPPPRARSRDELLARADFHARSAEICHAASFVVALVAALLYLAYGRTTEAAWISGFNVLLNGYPVMLQRVHRWRIQRVRRARLPPVA